MMKHRVSTTISQKHWDLLQKYAGKYETHQKTIEVALESLEKIESKKDSSISDPSFTLEDEIWLFLKSLNSTCLLPKDSLQQLFKTADIEIAMEYIKQTNSIAYALEYYMKKPFSKCSAKEIIDTLVIFIRVSNAFDTIDFKEYDNHYNLILIHTLGINASNILCMFYERILESCGIKVESVISEKTIFMTIYKNGIRTSK